MKKLALVLSALGLALSLAAPQSASAQAEYQPTRVTSRFKRIAVIRPSRWDAIFSGSVQSYRANLDCMLGNLLDAARENGLEVHYYDTAFFEGTDSTSQQLWTNMGSRYSAAIILHPNTSVARFSRYVCADSTNVQIIVVGGAEAPITSWMPDTTVRGFVDAIGQAGLVGISQTKGSCLVTYDNQDTLWGTRIPSGRRMISLASGIDGVYRLFKVVQTSGVHFGTVSDTTNAIMPGADSLAQAAEYLGPMWKVRFSTYSGQGRAIWPNSLAGAARGASDGGQSPRETYWVRLNNSTTSASASPHYIWALLCRFTNVKPIKWAYDWDDITDKFFDNLGQPPRWRATAVDSSLEALRQFGIIPTMMVNPVHAAAYINALNPSYEAAWSGPGHTYLQNYTWVHHSHDSTTANVSSNLVGGFGGYGTGNGATVGSVQSWGRRYASRFDPTSTGQPGESMFGAGGRFGMVQRYQYSDSVRRVNAPAARVPPYVVSPNNQMLPVNFKARGNTYSIQYYSPSASCPIDSVLWAYDISLNKGNGNERRKLFLRSLVDNPKAQHLQWDRDSVVAYSLFLYPNERFVVPVNGRLVQAIGVNSFLQGASPRTQYVADANFRAANLLGLKNPVPVAERTNPLYNTTYTTDVMNVYSMALVGNIDMPFRQSTRVVYQHPGQHSTTIAAFGDYHVDVFIRSIATQFRAMDKLAGRATQKCVGAWQVYEP